MHYNRWNFGAAVTLSLPASVLKYLEIKQLMNFSSTCFILLVD
jgi:hypothetical protein